MDGFGELLGSIRRDHFVVQIQKISFAVLLEHCPKDPAMPVIIRRLKVPTVIAIVISLTLVGILAWLGVMKPVLW